MSYRAILKSVPNSFLEHSALRYLTTAGSAWFAMFSGIWVTLALYPATLLFGYGPAVAGSFGVIGAAGVVSSQVAGRASDRFGAGAVISGSLALACLGILSFLLFRQSLTGLVAGILLMDIDCFGAQPANQAQALAISPPTANRVYSAYTVVYYTIGTIGAFIAPVIFTWFGWQGVCGALCSARWLCSRQ
ncbi:hypothetical protein [Breoghania sp.]|uniref:hypothetical protein n=1 Tax=Breoghania sp. TaxID=2065378 RepID=UPI00260DB0CD|nr:hypothetical protein [Breoghania sp.]MDJ0933524.1 hypothetical protein [Breoghania sp.]